MEEVYDQPDVVVGKFLINSFTTLVLFDTGATHSFISRGFVDKFKLPTVALKIPMLVSSPGAESMASRGCFQLPLTIGRHVFPHKPWYPRITRIGCDPRHGLATEV